MNFVNRSNEADQRVFELLEQKFKLFEGVFGSSDEILGAIESGVDFERRISDIYRRCRTPTEIHQAFSELQNELSIEIDESMRKTRQKLLENFDEAVHKRLRVSDEKSKHNLGRFEQLLMQLTQTELDSFATFDDNGFDLHRSPGLEGAPLGRYELPRRSSEVHLYRLSHPLAQHVIAQAKTRPLEMAHLEFDYGAYPNKITVIEKLRGQCGWLRLSRFTVSALTQTEDHLILAALTDEGVILEPGVARDLFKLAARSQPGVATLPANALEHATQAQQNAIQRGINERNALYFEEEAARLDAWAEDLKVGLERDLKDIDRQIKEPRRE